MQGMQKVIMSEKLNFGNAGKEFSVFDSVGDGFAFFDAADGVTHIPAGWYQCTLESGEAVITKTGKPGYRLRFAVYDGPHTGFALWRYFTFHDRPSAERAKLGLAPLGLKTSADLKMLFPAVGQKIVCRVLVAVQERIDGSFSNDVQRFEVESNEAAATNPFTVDLGKSEGGKT